MRKFLATGLLALLAAGAAQAQAIFGYSVTQSAGTYTPLGSPTVIFDASTATVAADEFENCLITPDGVQTADGSYAGYDLGFEVNMAGKTFSKFAVSGSGYLLLGNDEIGFQKNMAANFLRYGEGYNIAGMACNRGMQSGTDTKVAYAVSGTGSDQCLTVQFEKVGIMTAFWGNATAFPDYQLKLYKDGRMQLVFNNFSTMGDSEFFQLTMGLRQGEDYVCAEGEPGALSLLRGKTSTVNYTNTTADGTTITFNVPVECVRPSAQPTDLQMEVTSCTIDGTFTGCEGADTYLVVYATGDNTPAVPVDKTSYAEGDMIGENTTVAYFGSDTEFDLRGLAGGTKYNFAIYAAKAYGLNGPLYNTTSPLAATVETMPTGPKAADVVGRTLSSISLKVTPNDNNDNVVVIYNSYPERDNYGDHGLFGNIPADVKAGDVLPVPEDFVPSTIIPGVGEPANAGTVAYVGKATDEPIVISGLESTTLYYIGVYSMNEAGQVCVNGSHYASIEPVYTGSFTTIENPWEGDMATYPRYMMPYGWETAADGSDESGYRDEVLTDRDGTPSRGSQAVQLRTQIQRGDAANGKVAWMTLPPVDVSERHMTVDFSYSIVEGLNRFTSQGYNTWAEDDVLEIQVSDDEGQTWNTLTAYTAENNPKQQVPEGMEVDEQRGEAYYTQFGYVNISADLNDYRGKTVLVKLYWKTYATPGFGMNMYVDRVSVKQAEFPEVPEVNVVKITDNSATVNWTSAQTDYQLVYNEVDADSFTTVNVNGAMTYDLTGLKANTEYEVKVRGLLADGENYSEWSDAVQFKTADYPAVDAPENLKSDVETLASLGYVLLSWDKATDAEKYEVAYRLSSATEWTYKESTETSMMLTELEGGETYVWKVRAFCTHDRETAYSAQARFTAPEVVGIDGVNSDEVSIQAGSGYINVANAAGARVAVYNAAGSEVVNADHVDNARYEVAPGLYIVVAGNRSAKVMVR